MSVRSFNFIQDVQQAMRNLHIWLQSALMLITVASAAMAFAQQGPHLSLNENEFDLGDRLCYREFSHVFTLRNTGAAPLELAIEKKSCGCTTDMISSNVIAPASSAEVSVGFQPNPKNERVGMQIFSVQLSTNDPDNKNIVLSVGANLVEQVRAEPTQIKLFGDDKAARNAALRIMCFADEAVPEVLSVRCDAPNIRIEQREVEKTAGAAVHNYAVRLLPPVLRRQVEYIYVETSSTRVPTLEIPVQIEVSSSGDVKPSRILFGIIDARRRSERKAIVKVSGENAGNLSCKSSDSRVTASLEPISDGHWKLRVVIEGLPITKVEQINAEINVIDAAGKRISLVPVMATLLP